MNLTTKICLPLIALLFSFALYATTSGVPVCDTMFTKHLDASKGECLAR